MQIESPGALDNAEQIARVPGVDVLMLGPGDFSVLSGIPFQFSHELIHDAYRRVAEAARKAGKAWGTTSPSPDHSQMLMDLGARFICHQADILILKQGLESIQERYAALGFTFDNRLAAEAATMGNKP